MLVKAFSDVILKVVAGMGPPQSNCTAEHREQGRNSSSDTKISVSLGNDEQILQSDYSVRSAGPARKPVADRRCSYRLSD